MSDITRLLFDRKNHRSGMREQQGRVHIDADFNELADIQQYRVATETVDVIGVTGVPMQNGGFAIANAVGGGDLTISPGRIYLSGLLFEAESGASYKIQPHYLNPDLSAFTPPGGAPGPLNDGLYLVYLEGWQREINFLDDPNIQEVALRDVDTTTRLQNVWRVKLLPVTSVNAATCASSLTEWDSLTATLNGTLIAQMVTATPDSPCVLPPSSGYTGLENQTYRFEVFQVVTGSVPTFVWSRNNASVETKIIWVLDDVITVADTGKDDVLGFASDQWVQIVESEPTIDNAKLFQIGSIDSFDSIKINLRSSASQFNGKTGLKLRRWDMTGDNLDNGIPMATSWIPIENGIQVKFNNGTFKTGDYWLGIGRTITGKFELVPYGPANTPQPPAGTPHYFARLAMVDVQGGVITTSDCRNLFPTLTDMTELRYVGGDGQEAIPGSILPDTIKVGVANGKWAVQGASVQFSITSGGGSLSLPAGGGAANLTTVIATTDARGIAECNWTLDTDTSNPKLQVQANLLDTTNSVLLNLLPVIFNAGFTMTGTGSGCSVTVGKGAQFPTLAEALNKLGNDRDVSICLLPGEHTIDIKNPVSFNSPKNTLKISGYTANISMAGGAIQLVANKLVLEGLLLSVASDENNNGTEAAIILAANDLNVTDCSFKSLDSDFYLKQAFIQIRRIPDSKLAPILKWTQNQVSIGVKSNGTALAIEPNISGWVEKNIINGLLALYSKGRPDWAPDSAKNIINLIKVGDSLGGELHIRGNLMNNILTDAQGVEDPNNKTIIYQSLIVAENIFQRPVLNKVNSLVGKYINFVNNQFVENKIENTVQLVGKSAIIIGNIATNDNTRIQAFVDKAVGVAPPVLNLVVVTKN